MPRHSLRVYWWVYASVIKRKRFLEVPRLRKSLFWEYSLCICVKCIDILVVLKASGLCLKFWVQVYSTKEILTPLYLTLKSLYIWIKTVYWWNTNRESHFVQSVLVSFLCLICISTHCIVATGGIFFFDTGVLISSSGFNVIWKLH